MLGKVFLFLVCYNGCGKNRFLANGEAASFREKAGFFPEIAFWGKSSPETLDRQADGHSAVPADLQAQLTLV